MLGLLPALTRDTADTDEVSFFIEARYHLLFLMFSLHFTRALLEQVNKKLKEDS